MPNSAEATTLLRAIADQFAVIQTKDARVIRVYLYFAESATLKTSDQFVKWTGPLVTNPDEGELIGSLWGAQVYELEAIPPGTVICQPAPSAAFAVPLS